jgi:hypothetical protein
MEADASVLADVLPTDSLSASGRPLGPLREELYRIPDLENVGHVVGVWVQSLGVLLLAAWVADRVAWPWQVVAWLFAFLLMGRSIVRFAILGHEAAHRLLFSNRKVNDWVGGWLCAYPAFVPLEAYRRGHMAHHKEEFGPTEPDMVLYNGYPLTKDSWHRKLRRDADGETGWKNLKLLLNALLSIPSIIDDRRWVVVLTNGYVDEEQVKFFMPWKASCIGRLLSTPQIHISRIIKSICPSFWNAEVLSF